MNKTCSRIQRKLDELLLDDELGVEVSDHLKACPTCSEFHLKGTRLRQIVGGLGTVPAPSDFDFRLRARLATESRPTSHISLLSLRSRTVGAALAVALLVGLSFVVFQMTRPKASTNTAISNTGAPKPVDTPNVNKQVPNQTQEKQPANETLATTTTVNSSRSGGQKRGTPIVIRPKRPAAVEEFSSTVAPSVRDNRNNGKNEAVFSVDASQQSLRVSLYDSQGNPRTISVPTVSFGSQRVVPTTTSFAPKGVW